MECGGENLRTDKMNIDEFVSYHNSNYVYYCEVIIHPDGDVSYCVPSHQEKLISETGLPREVLWDIIGIHEDVLLRLVNMTGCISVWYDLYVSPSDISCAQFNSLQKLVTKGCVNSALNPDTKPGYHYKESDNR